ncbi:MAG: hypothetical protein IPH05_03525 [Flavobacteriales bacterium]|nr:hypothetical protein [Flavobacteriales bacterium]
MLKLRSTPQLSTLNGHEATMSIGQTEYYLEVRNDLIGTQNPTVTTSQTYKPIKADLSLRIPPIVSSEDMVTLEIEVNQSSFTSRIAATAPPGSVERKFSSIVRAANKDMIILGGLEEKENSKSGSGVPFLSASPCSNGSSARAPRRCGRASSPSSYDPPSSTEHGRRSIGSEGR